MMKSKFDTKIILIFMALFLAVNASYAIDDKVAQNNSESNLTVAEAQAKAEAEIKAEVEAEIQQKKQPFFKKINFFKKSAKQTADTVEEKSSDILEGSTTVEENAKQEADNTTLIEKSTELEKTVVDDTTVETSPFTNDKSIDEIKKQVVDNPDSETKPIYTNEIHSVLTLDDAIKIAIEYNPTVRSAVYAAQAQRTKIGQAWSKYFPSLGAGIQFGRVGDRIDDKTTNTNATMLPTVSGNLLLFDFGKTKANADSAKRAFEAKNADTQETINVLIYSIKSAYYNVLFAQAQVKVYEDTVKDYELQLQRALSFYNVGKKAKIDVITAEYNLGKAKLNLVKAENVLDVANAQLSRIMGIPEYTNYELGSKLGTVKYDIEQEDAIKTAFEVRPELLSAHKKSEAARLNLRAKRREFTPDIGAFGGYDNLTSNKYSYQFGVGLNYTAMNIALVKKQVDEAKATYKKSLADYEDVKHSLYLTVKQSYLDLKTAEEAIVIAKLALDEAKEQYRQVSGRYKAGVGDIIELKDGETTYLNARLDFYNALLNYNTCAANLEKEIGTPLSTTSESVLKDMNYEEN